MLAMDTTRTENTRGTIATWMNRMKMSPTNLRLEIGGYTNPRSIPVSMPMKILVVSDCRNHHFISNLPCE